MPRTFTPTSDKLPLPARIKRALGRVLFNFNFVVGLRNFVVGLRLAPFRATQLLRVDAIRFVVAWIRFAYLKRSHGIRSFTEHGEAVTENTVWHNMRGLSDLAVVRSQLLLRPLSVIESIPRDARVLAIGPRTEGELLNLMAHGFRRWNVRGLDLISYTPWIDLGDMHDMPYADNSWDVIILAWVIAYSSDWQQVAREVIRVARDGAVVAVGIEHNPRSDEELAAIWGYRVGNDERAKSTDDILSLFGGHVDAVYFQHDVAPSQRHEVGGIAAVFSIRK